VLATQGRLDLGRPPLQMAAAAAAAKRRCDPGVRQPARPIRCRRDRQDRKGIGRAQVIAEAERAAGK